MSIHDCFRGARPPSYGTNVLEAKKRKAPLGGAFRFFASPHIAICASDGVGIRGMIGDGETTKEAVI